MPMQEGTRFAGYRIVRSLGSGGMGEVYLAQHPRLPRLDALKVLPRQWADNPEYRQRFLREADAASTLFHPHIVGVHDRGEFEGQLWISMDYVAGADLGQLISQQYRSGMPPEQVAVVVAAVAEALDYAHQRGLLHRDVKPANIMISSADQDSPPRVMLTDFGIARSLEEISGLTMTNMTVGTVAYAAPEQLRGDPVDGRSDQYALASTAHYLLTGQKLFPQSNPAAVVSAHQLTPPPPVSQTRPELAALDPVLATALAKDPQQRYPRTRDFGADFAARIAALPTTGTQPAEPYYPVAAQSDSAAVEPSAHTAPWTPTTTPSPAATATWTREPRTSSPEVTPPPPGAPTSATAPWPPAPPTSPPHQAAAHAPYSPAQGSVVAPAPHRRRPRRAVIIIALVAVVAIVGALSTLGVTRWLDHREAQARAADRHNAQLAGEKYLQALAAGDAEAALSVSAIPPEDSRFLTNDVLAAQMVSTPVTDIAVTVDEADPDASGAVRVHLAAVFGEQSTQATVVARVVDGEWKLDTTTVTVPLGAPGSEADRSLDAVAIGGVPTAGARTLTLFPGTPAVSSDNRFVDITAEPTPILLEQLTDDDTAPITPTVTLNDAGRQASLASVEERHRYCYNGATNPVECCPNGDPAQCKRPPPPGYRDITVAGTLKVDRLVSTSLQYAFNPAAMDVIVTGTMIYTAEAENMDGGPRLTDLEANIDLRNGIRVDLSRDPPPRGTPIP